ncbi:Uncharacterized iron-regulated membrane protein [Verrucomicrobium sp. GAS474]|nr:Uncharacterized iron-regulated membrane protein [Verrucomicrobium sp. GAS474]
MVFKEAIDKALHPAFYFVPAAEQKGEKLSLDLLVAKVAEAWPGWRVTVISLESYREADRALWVRLRSDAERSNAYVSVDPYTGRVGELRRNAWNDWVLRLHSTLLLGNWGGAAACLFALGLIGLGVSGLIVLGGRLRGVPFLPRRERGARLSLSDLHKTVGFYALLFNLVLALTGGWMNLFVFPRLFAPKKTPPPMTMTVAAAPVPISGAIAAARTALPDLEPEYLFLSPRPGGPVSVYGGVPHAWFSHPFCSGVTVDAKTLQPLKVRDFRTLKGGEKILSYVTPLHFGNFGGWPIKVVYVLGGLTPGVLSASGCAIWWMRRKKAAAVSAATAVTT